MSVAAVLQKSQHELLLTAWDKRESFDFESAQANELKSIVNEVIAKLDSGDIRIANKQDGEWHIDAEAKIAVLLSFRFNKNELSTGGPATENWQSYWYDKVASKFANWNAEDFQNPNIRAVPGSFVRYGSYIGSNVVLMPSFVNIGAYVGDGTLVDTWATVGSCAQIGNNCHISGGAGIGGVLEPIQAAPTIIEDNCFIGARSEVAEGVIVREGAVLSMGVFLGSSTKIIDRETGKVYVGEVPAYSVVVPGSVPSSNDTDFNKPFLNAAIIVKTVDDRTRAKTSVNELLRACV